MPKKRNIAITLIAFLICCFFILALTASHFISYSKILKIERAAGDTTFFSGNLFGLNVFGTLNDNNLFKVKILNATLKKARCPDVIKSNKDIFVVLVNENSLEIYTVQASYLGTYRLKGSSASIKSYYISDMNHDGSEDILLLCGEKGSQYGEDLSVLSFNPKSRATEEHSGFLKEIYLHTFKGLNPWKVQAADVDGDSGKEISIGVFKTSTFSPVLAKRPFIYNWREGYISPKWLGSRLSRPFDDYIFADINSDGRDELISIESLPGGSKVINSYSWKGFGFEGSGESKIFQDISDVRKGESTGDSGCEIIARVKENNSWHWISIYYNNEKLLFKNELNDFVTVVIKT